MPARSTTWPLQFSQNCRSTGGEDASERTDPVMMRNVLRLTVAQATTWDPVARRQDSQWQKQGATTGSPHSAATWSAGRTPPSGATLSTTVAGLVADHLGGSAAFLSLVLNEAFGPMGAERFHLDCFADNARAQRAYLKLGFSRDGVLRQAYRLADGRRSDLIMMAILKSEWEARHR